MAETYYAMTREQVLPYIKDTRSLPVSELKSAIRGSVLTRNEPEFDQNLKLFNGGLQSPACMLVFPRSAKDVSEYGPTALPTFEENPYSLTDRAIVFRIILFCTRHGLSPSVKAGGYGTHGLAVEGDVIIDLRDINDISISIEASPPGSTSTMDTSPGDRPPPVEGPPLSQLSNALQFGAYPSSSNDEIYLPPDLLKRKREIDDEGENGSSGRATPGPNPDATTTPPTGRPSTTSSTIGESSSSEMIRGAGNRSVSSSASATGSSGSGADAAQSGTRRTRPRLSGPDAGPSDEAMFLTVPSPAPPPSLPLGPPSRSESSRSPISDGRDRLSRSPLSTSAADDDPTPPLPLTSAHSPAPASPSPLAPIGRPGPPPPAAVVPPPRGPFSYPSSSSRPSGPFGYGADTVSTSTPPSRPSGPFGYGADANSTSASTSFADHSGQASGSSASYAIHPIEPPHPFVYVTFGAGASQRHVDAYMTDHPFYGTTAVGAPIKVPYYVPFAAHPNGSAVMLLGGFGFQTRLRGLSVDALVEVEMVLADGRIITVNEREHPAPSLMKHFRDCIKSAPRELYANVILTAGPRKDQHGGALVVIQICWLGPREGGAPIVNAILSWSGGSCLLNEVAEKTFQNQQDSVAKVLKAGTWLFELGAGAQTDFKDSCISPAVRAGNFNVVAFHQWRLQDVDARCVDSAEEWMQDSVNKVSAGGPIPAFSERKELVSRTVGMYGDENWQRLIEVKRKYDPKGEIRHCFWPLNEEGRPLGLDVREEPLVDGALEEERSKGKPLSGPPTADSKGKGREDKRHGNHFMDRFLLP
ncbi:hypothetical protein FRC00_003230 [Tulasnella sp. 408]|nr:hypothetical protein FRC00_003230 [Tulasnella sp. 408]